MAELVALALSSGQAFVQELQRQWDHGNAVLPVDLRLPPSARQILLEAMAPHRIIDDRGETSLVSPAPIEPGDALVMSTSGTTGMPKGVVLTHAAVEAAAVATSRAVGADRDADHWLCCLPVAHLGGLGVVTRALLTGTPVTIHDRFDPDAVMDGARSGATLVSLVAAAMRRIDPQLFRLIVLGGGPVPPDRPANAVATYGLTETCGGIVYDGQPIAGVSMRIAADGEIELSSPTLLRCYRDGSSPLTPDGWLRTGDRGSIVDGVLSVHGRSGDLIITGGENVWPAPIEAILVTHAKVGSVAIVGRPDPEWGQRVTAVIEPAGDDAPSLEELRDLVRQQLPAFCAPQALELAELPRTALGKVRRADL